MATVVTNVVLDGIATDADLMRLGVPVLGTRLVLPTEVGAACGCHLSGAEHRPLVTRWSGATVGGRTGDSGSVFRSLA
ncbi:hypothetical protein MOQ72_34945 [Saccharopolyspora sp. K220]|uniref:hypothetical protein n=1 Tax=Saccharopolyspora soli TaxID=2926618 RepID=UPI001F563B63|nr:hypothetical protein [Saccharopolyspora soli]MCI2422636.1 hypothetical protein [Saccharopolyspora soli]